MDNFHQNYKDKDIFLKSWYNFRDWRYLDPPKGPPLDTLDNRRIPDHIEPYQNKTKTNRGHDIRYFTIPQSFFSGYKFNILHSRHIIYSAVGGAYAPPRKIKFGTKFLKNRFFNFILEKSSLIKSYQLIS